MAECHAALLGCAFGALGPLLSSGVGRATGLSPEGTGSGRVIPRQPSGVISLFGALGSSSVAAVAALSSGSVVAGALCGAAVACCITGVATGDMLKRRNLLSSEPGLVLG
ncbi:unnamed protein product [Symbiodinium natans]|uniref:Uncharacterized protein n=1 Tax=Symbiodinium natans TaxID=878477 RepID=A0A812QJT1_9DINO|nr:unnamed protein product [Symbiodinium natans]